jgi:Uncharacterized protein conserved in bacteria
MALIVIIAGGGAVYRFVPIKRDVTAADGQHYRGAMKNGRYHGQGVLTYPPGRRYNDMLSYAGDFVDGQRHGRGTLTWRTGNTYEGEWLNDDAIGRGVFTYVPSTEYDMLSYTGGVLGGERHGQGTLILRDGGKHEGEWKNDQLNGQSVMIGMADENWLSYTGDVRDGDRHGQGTLIWRDGTKYEGRWRDGWMHGRGVMTFPGGGQRYEGDFESGRPSGQGVMIWFYGLMKYEGQWRDGRMNGQGVLTWRKGGRREGRWKNGELYNGRAYDAAGREIFRMNDGQKQNAADSGGRKP